jgi:3-oxoacyl-[acyl-carrier protein] reductase
MAERFFGGDEAGRRAMLEGLPLGRICTPLEIARTTLFLASEDASLIVGQSINADGGWAYVKS